MRGEGKQADLHGNAEHRAGKGCGQSQMEDSDCGVRREREPEKPYRRHTVPGNTNARSHARARARALPFLKV